MKWLLCSWYFVFIYAKIPHVLNISILPNSSSNRVTRLLKSTCLDRALAFTDLMFLAQRIVFIQPCIASNQWLSPNNGLLFFQLQLSEVTYDNPGSTLQPTVEPQLCGVRRLIHDGGMPELSISSHCRRKSSFFIGRHEMNIRGNTVDIYQIKHRG